MGRRLAVVMAILAGLGWGLAAQQIPAVRVEQSPKIDGDLGDAVWAKAQPFSAFRQSEPAANGEPSAATEMWVLYDRDHLYLAFYCHDSDPSQITAHTMAHDANGGEESNDDLLSILIDPFQNRREAYVFFINPRGARSEGLAHGESCSLNWDGIWRGAARIVADGWCAEIAIPFRTISFKPGLSQWGLNVERYIARKMERIRLAGTTPDAHFFAPMNAATLAGISDIHQGLGLTIRPYGTLRSLADPGSGSDRQWQLDGGFDIYKSLTPSFTAAFSYNTDFAETESDSRQINLTRFSLYFPEKRTFFLEGSDYFAFGTGIGEESFLPFFSRRIGLAQEQQIPISFGTKVFGRLGEFNIALINVQAGAYEPLQLGSRNYFAGRISQNILEESRVGLIVTAGNPEGGAANTLVGADFIYKTSHLFGDKNFSVGGWWVYNWNELAGDHGGFGGKIDYPNDLFDMNLSYSRFGAALNPGLGFLPRAGVQTLQVGGLYGPRPEGWLGEWVRRFSFECYAGFYWDLQGALQTYQIFTAPLNFRTQGGDHFEFNVMPNYDVLPEAFAVSAGVTIPAGAYRYTNFRLAYESAAHRWWSLNCEYSFGQFYSGTYTNLEIGAGLRFQGRAQINLQAELVHGDLPQGVFDQSLYQLKFDWFFSPQLSLFTFIQFDSVSNGLGANIRLRWELNPGNEVFLVFNQNWERRWDPLLRFLPLEDRGIVKIQFTIRP
jgi:hypothetical protein